MSPMTTAPSGTRGRVEPATRARADSGITWMRAITALFVLLAAGQHLAQAAPSKPFAAFAPEPIGLDLTESTFAADLESPWGMEFLPDGRLLVTERAGRLRVVDRNGIGVSPAVRGLPKADHRDHGGLLDVRIDTRFATNRVIYFSYTEAGPGGAADRNGLTVARARLSADATSIDRFRVLFRQTPRVAGGENLGGRLAVSADGYLFITVGDRRVPSQRVRTQDLSFYNGKTLRIRTDGAIPADNPFVKRRGARPEIWSLGHRNPQGALVHPGSGDLWVVEHGPFGGDELNIVRAGRNYGWPVISYGCEYDTCAAIGEGTAKAGMEPPLTHWGRPGIAPSSLILYTGEQLPGWKGSVFVSTLAGRAVWRLTLAGDADDLHVVNRELLFAGLGERIRDLRQGPDGALYLLTDGKQARVIRVARRGELMPSWKSGSAPSAGAVLAQALSMPAVRAAQRVPAPQAPHRRPISAPGAAQPCLQRLDLVQQVECERDARGVDLEFAGQRDREPGAAQRRAGETPAGRRIAAGLQHAFDNPDPDLLRLRAAGPA